MHSECLKLQVSEACNNNCWFCKNPSIEIKQIQEALDAEGLAKGQRLVISAREPTLYKGLPILVKKAFSLFEMIEVNTNGRMLAVPAFLKEFKPFQKKLVFNVSLHASRRDIHDFLTRTEDSWIQSVKGLLDLASAGFDTKVSTVLTKCNDSNLKSMPFLLKRLKASKWKIMLFEPAGLGKDNFFMLMPHHLILQDALTEIIESASKTGMALELRNIPFCFLAEGQLGKALVKNPVGIVPRIKAESCSTCCFNEKCAGFYERYFKEFRIEPGHALSPLKEGGGE